MTSRIFLVGFMGAGKTTVGRLLADRLGWSFVDLDTAVEERAGQSVREIFRSRGETAFRELEAECLRAASAPARRVVSLGGGTYADPGNRQHLESLGLSIYLEAPLEVLLERIGDDESRPLARDRESLGRLFAERVASYRMAGMSVATGDRDPRQVVDALLWALPEALPDLGEQPEDS
jgi:shikimate kinase